MDMPQVDFSQFPYYPSLQCENGEHLGYRNLSDDDKEAIVPIFELSRRSRAPNLNGSLDFVRTSVERRPFVLGLSHNPAPPPHIPRRDLTEADRRRIEQETQSQREYNATISQLLDPQNGFGNWRAYVAQIPNAIPLIQYTNAATQARDILRQAALLSRGGNSIAISVRQENAEALLPTLLQIYSVLDSPDAMLLIVDCEQGRQFIGQRAMFARDFIRHLVGSLPPSDVPMVRAVCMSSSFSHPSHEGLRLTRNFDLRLWNEARTSFPFYRGDYAGMVRRPPSSFIPDEFRATVVYATDDGWLVYRDPETSRSAGWIDGALEVTTSGLFPPEPNTWGTQMIRRAARGDLQDLDSPVYWYAVKVNIHIHRHIALGIPEEDEMGD